MASSLACGRLPVPALADSVVAVFRALHVPGTTPAHDAACVTSGDSHLLRVATKLFYSSGLADCGPLHLGPLSRLQLEKAARNFAPDGQTEAESFPLATPEWAPVLAADLPPLSLQELIAAYHLGRSHTAVARIREAVKHYRSRIPESAVREKLVPLCREHPASRREDPQERRRARDTLFRARILRAIAARLFLTTSRSPGPRELTDLLRCLAYATAWRAAAQEAAAALPVPTPHLVTKHGSRAAALLQAMAAVDARRQEENDSVYASVLELAHQECFASSLAMPLRPLKPHFRGRVKGGRPRRTANRKRWTWIGPQWTPPWFRRRSWKPQSWHWKH